MATLRDYFQNQNNAKEFISKHGVKAFIETGTGIGESVHFMAGLVNHCFSIEIEPEIYERAKSMLSDKENVTLINMDSVSGLQHIFTSYVFSDLPTLFFLDAHFPGADFGIRGYADEKNEDKRIPLKSELETIIENRDVSSDVFIIDDLRIYVDGEFGDGNWPHRKELGGDGVKFIKEMFQNTHHITVDYRYQGFIILEPK